MKPKIEGMLSKALGAVWLGIFGIASVTILIGIIKLFLSVVGVI